MGTLCFMMNAVHRFIFAKQMLHTNEVSASSEYFHHLNISPTFADRYQLLSEQDFRLSCWFVAPQKSPACRT